MPRQRPTVLAPRHVRAAIIGVFGRRRQWRFMPAVGEHRAANRQCTATTPPRHEPCRLAKWTSMVGFAVPQRPSRQQSPLAPRPLLGEIGWGDFAPKVTKSIRGGFILCVPREMDSRFSLFCSWFFMWLEFDRFRFRPTPFESGGKIEMSSSSGGGPPKLPSPSGGGRVGALEVVVPAGVSSCWESKRPKDLACHCVRVIYVRILENPATTRFNLSNSASTDHAVVHR